MPNSGRLVFRLQANVEVVLRDAYVMMDFVGKHSAEVP